MRLQLRCCLKKASQLWLVAVYLVVTIQALSHAGPNHLLILGLGRVGTEIALTADSLFTTITGTVREEHSSLNGVNMIPFQEKHIRQILPVCTHILITLPPPRAQDDELDAVLELIDHFFPAHGWIGMISTTGVYGNHNGATVTEESDCHDSSESARRFLEWEADFQEKCKRNHHQLAIFRCAGIYGPGRSALHTAFKQGPTAVMEGQSSLVTNRIHTADLSRAVVYCMKQSRMSDQHDSVCDEFQIFNLADDLPESRAVVLDHARNMLMHAGLLNTSIPVESVSSSSSEPVVVSNRARRRVTDEKRVSNKRMKDILLSRDSLIYPTYKEGLEQIFQNPSEPWWNK